MVFFPTPGISFNFSSDEFFNSFKVLIPELNNVKAVPSPIPSTLVKSL